MQYLQHIVNYSIEKYCTIKFIGFVTYTVYGLSMTVLYVPISDPATYRRKGSPSSSDEVSGKVIHCCLLRFIYNSSHRHHRLFVDKY